MSISHVGLLITVEYGLENFIKFKVVGYDSTNEYYQIKRIKISGKALSRLNELYDTKEPKYWRCSLFGNKITNLILNKKYYSKGEHYNIKICNLEHKINKLLKI